MTSRRLTRSVVRSVCTACLGASVWAGTLAAQEPLELRLPVPPDAYLKIWGGAGTVEVIGWDQDSLVVTGTRYPGPGRFFHQVEGGVGKFGFEVDQEEAGAVRADLLVRLPRSSTVWIKVASAAVTAREIDGALDIFSVSGPVEVEGSPETAYVESMAGDIGLDLDGGGVVRAKTGRGDVTVHGQVLDLTASSVNGAIEVDSPTVRRAELESIDGQVTYRGGLARGGWLSVETHGGDVELVFPVELGAAFDLATVQGRIDNQLTVGRVSRPAFPGARILLEMGTGEAEVEVRSFSGTIRVRTDPGLAAEVD